MAEMTMRQALELAATMGHVPVRISGPPIDMTGGGPSNPLDTVTGEWGVPDGQGGVIPLSALQTPSSPPAQGSQAPRTANTSLSDELRSNPPTPPSTTGPMVSAASSLQTPSSPTARPPGVQGPLMQNGQFGAGPQVGPPRLANPRYDFPANATGQPAGTGPIIVNVNTPENRPPGLNPTAAQDAQSRHYQINPNFYGVAPGQMAAPANTAPRPGPTSSAVGAPPQPNYNPLAGVGAAIESAQPATDAYRQGVSNLTGVNLGSPEQMTQDYRRWIMGVTGLDQIPPFAGVSPTQGSQGGYNPFTMPPEVLGQTPFGNPSAMFNPDYPFSPSYRFPR